VTAQLEIRMEFGGRGDVGLRESDTNRKPAGCPRVAHHCTPKNRVAIDTVVGGACSYLNLSGTRRAATDHNRNAVKARKIAPPRALAKTAINSYI
jgi:hypothetical protein